MPRPRPQDLADISEVDLGALIDTGEDTLLQAFTALSHYYDSTHFRREIMAAAQFPTDDMQAFLVVNQLSIRGAMRPTDLSEALQTVPSNITRIARILAELDLAVRVKDPRDERGVRIALTDYGRRVGERIIAYEAAWVPGRLVHWEPDELDVFRRQFIRMVADIGASLPQGLARSFHFPSPAVAPADR